MKKLFINLTTILVLFLLSACGMGDRYIRGLFTEQNPEIPLFMDDFNDHDNGWLLTVTDQGVAHYDGDSIRILINESNATYWTSPGLNLKDSIMDVDAVKVTGPDDNLFGLICRFRDEQHYYSFLVSSDGYYGILKVQDGKREFLGAPAMQISDMIQKDEKTNHLRADCVGNKLSLYANWTKLMEVEDDTFSEGDVGIVGATRDTVGTDIRFDNFIVISPQ